MRLLMLIVNAARKEELEAFLGQAGVLGYTEISRAVGVGSSAPRLGSRAFPETSAIVFTLVEEGALDSLRAKLASFCTSCGERLRMVAWPVEELGGTAD